jgi:hypothetical protein
VGVIQYSMTSLGQARAWMRAPARVKFCSLINPPQNPLRREGTLSVRLRVGMAAVGSVSLFLRAICIIPFHRRGRGRVHSFIVQPDVASCHGGTTSSYSPLFTTVYHRVRHGVAQFQMLPCGVETSNRPTLSFGDFLIG